MANPGGAVAAKKDEQIEHVLNAVLERVIAMGAVAGGLAVDAHVRGDAAESEGGEAAQLVAPAIPEVRPTVDEDDERAGFGAVGEIETATPPAALVELITPARLQGAAAQLGRHLARGPGNFGNFLALERRQLRQKADENATLSLICIKASWHFPFKNWRSDPDEFSYLAQQVSDLPSLRGRHLLSERYEEVTKNLSLQKLADVLTRLSDPVRLSSVWVRRRVAIRAAP